MAGKSLTIGDLVYSLGFANEEEFVKGLESVLKKAEKTTEKSGGDAGKAGGKAAGRGFTDQFKATFGGAALGSFLGAALAGVFSGAVAAAQKFAIDSVREFAVYEQGLLQLKLAGETNLSALSKRIQDTAKATKVFSATDVSLAVGDLVKAGYDAETAFALVETGALGAASEVDAATGKFGDLGATAGQLGNILRALGLETSQSSRVMDVMARAAQDSNLNVSDLVDIISRVGPTAKLAGLEIEDLAAMAGVLANNGMEASLIGTGLRSVLQSLINPTGSVKGELDKLGISLVDGNGNLRNFNDVLDGLHELTERGGEGLQILTAATGSFGSAAAANLGSASETVKEFRQNMTDAEGTAQTLADTMRNSAAGAAAEMAARIKDAKAELGEQLMPILLSLNESVFPALVGLLGGLIEKWTQWEFIITGTTTAIKQSNEALQATIVDRLGQELADALNAVIAARQRVSDAEQALANQTFNYGAGNRRREAELAAAKEALAVEEARFELLKKQKADADELARRQAGWSTDTPFGPLPAGVTREQAAAAAAATAEAYRNLAAVEKELEAERARFAAAATTEEERQSAARIKVLEAEVAAKKGLYATAQQAAKAAGVTKDPLAEEAQRVQNDLQRLKLAYEQGKLSAEQYEDAVAAHLRRVDGLYERAASPEQSTAVLRTRKVLLDELARLDKTAAEKAEAELQRVIDAHREYTDSLKAAQAAQDEVASRQTARAQRREDRALLRVVEAHQQYTQSLKDAAAAQAALEERIKAREQRREDRATMRVVEAHQQYTQSLKDAAAAQAALDARIAAREQRREDTALRRVIEAHNEYTASLKAAAEAQAELEAREAAFAAARQARLEREARDAAARQALANLYPGYAGNAAGPTLAERASGSLVKLAQAQRTLGVATRDDVQAALEGQISAIERLLPIVEEGSDRYYELVAALAAARGALATLNAEVPDAKIPGMGSIDQIKTALRETEATIARIQADIAAGPDTATLAMLESRLAFFQALLNELRQALNLQEQAAKDKSAGDSIEAEAEAIAGRLMDIATSFPKAIVSGIQSGDISGALRNALGNASDFFLDEMLKAIIGPITKELTASIASSLAAQSATGGAGGVMGALGPTGWVLGGLALVASMLIGSQQRKQIAERPATAAKAAVSGAPSVTYNLSATVQVQPGASFGDPAWEAKMRSFVQKVAEDLQARVPRKG